MTAFKSEKERLAQLDGIRGIAILLVIGFHYFYYSASPSNPSDLYPFGAAFVGVSLFKYGYLGVELFFIVSGFVIAMTLETCASPAEFLIKRFARLWPALLVTSLVIYTIVALSGSRYSATKPGHWFDFLPTLTLTPWQIWSSVFPNVDLIDGVHWSLIVEARFYIIAAVLYWGTRRFQFSIILFAFTIAVVILGAILNRNAPNAAIIFSFALYPGFMAWFSAGAIFYDLFRGQLPRWACAILLFALLFFLARGAFLAAPSDKSPVLVAGAIAIFFTLFWLLATRSRFVSFLAARWIAAVGVVSYSIYLLHNGLGLTIISLIPKGWPFLTQVFCALAVAIGAIALGFASFRWIETPARRFILKSTIRRSTTAARGI